jgi:hypothetical protein
MSSSNSPPASRHTHDTRLRAFRGGIEDEPHRCRSYGCAGPRDRRLTCDIASVADAIGAAIPKGNALDLWATLMMPLFITIETALIAGLEHSENQWKNLLAFPIPRWTIYIANS